MCIPCHAYPYFLGSIGRHCFRCHRYTNQTCAGFAFSLVDDSIIGDITLGVLHNSEQSQRTIYHLKSATMASTSRSTGCPFLSISTTSHFVCHNLPFTASNVYS